MKNSLKLGLVVSLALLLASQAHAQLKSGPIADPTNQGPPAGAILDLNGDPILAGYNQYSVNFTATDASTNLSFAFREDPAFLSLDDVTVTNLTTSTAVPVVNGGFESGIVGDNAPVGWSYLNMFGASYAGIVDNNNPHTGNNNYDGAVQAYDGITQALSTTAGDLYQISFWLADNSGGAGIGGTYSRLSTNGDVSDTGGNGIDLLVYAGAIPTLVPEPSSLVVSAISILFLAGFAGLRRRH